MSSFTGRTIAYLGPPKSEHSITLEHLARALEAGYVVIPDSSTQRVYDLPHPIASKAYRAYAQWYGTPRGAYLREVLNTIEARRVDLVVSYWGTNSLSDAIAIKKHSPSTAVIVNVLCHPQALTPRKIGLSNHLFRRASEHLDGFIFPGRAMYEYFREQIFRGNEPLCAVIPPCWHEGFHPDTYLPAGSGEPGILFLGRMDPSGERWDVVPDLLDELLAAGVHVYHGKPPDPRIPAPRPFPNRHPFPYRPLDEMIKYATQFPASLMAYNTSGLRHTERFRFTVPDRLITSVAAGLPIALPDQGYEACAEYLQSYGAVIRFRSANDLAAQLKDTAKMRYLKDLARANRQLYRAEAHAMRYLKYFQSILKSVPTHLKETSLA